MKTKIDVEISYIDYRINELVYFNKGTHYYWGQRRNKGIISCIVVDDYGMHPIYPRKWFVEEISSFLGKREQSTRNLIVDRIRLIIENEKTHK